MPGEAGKGSRNRTRNRNAFGKGHERAFGKSRRPAGGRKLFVRGEWIDPDEITPEQAQAIRANDAHNMVSVFGGVNPDQAAQFNRLYADQGAVADPVTGNVKYRDRPARLRNLKARGLHCMNEVQG